MEERLFVEKYRPQTVDDCVLPSRIKDVFKEYVRRKDIPNLMLCGKPGTGKTAVAFAMCKEIGLNYLHINASDENGIDILRNKIKNYATTVSLTGGKKVIILDEADGLSAAMQDGLRAALESFSSNCTFILTCNFKSKIIEAIHSRCAIIDFSLRADEKPKIAAEFFKRICHILDLENITYDKTVVGKIIEKFFPDMRRTIGELQRFSVTGTIDAGTLAQIVDIRNLSNLVKALKEKDFKETRKWVVLNSDVSSEFIFRKIYEGLYDFLEPEYIPQAILIIAKYQYQAAFCADQEINTLACLVEMLVDLKFK